MGFLVYEHGDREGNLIFIFFYFLVYGPGCFLGKTEENSLTVIYVLCLLYVQLPSECLFDGKQTFS